MDAMPTYQDRRGSRSDQTLILMTSLYLMLIGFFAVLNSLANHELVNSRTVIDSIKSTFNSVYAPRPPEVDLIADVQDIMPDEAYLGSIDKALKSYLSAKEYYATRGGNALIVEVRQSYIFFPGTLRLRRAYRDFLGAVAKAASISVIGGQRSVAVLVDTSASLPPARRANENIDFRRASVLVGQAADLGAPREGLSTGLMPTGGDKIYFVFLTRAHLASVAGRGEV